MNRTTVVPRFLGPLTIDPMTRKLTGPAGEAAVEPLVMRLLNLLVDDCGEVVPRRDLFDSLWGNAQIGDDSLNRLVVRLRQALVQSCGNCLSIETVPRMGYRLILREDEDVRPAFARRGAIAAIAIAMGAIAGTGLWRRSEAKAAAAEALIDEGDMRLQDAAPVAAGVALQPILAALGQDRHNARALGLLALAEETRANNGGSRDAGASLRTAEQSAKAALRIDPIEPHARLALLDISGASLDWSEWESRLLELRGQAPKNLHVLGSLTSFLQAAGQTSRAWSVNEQAAALAPSSPTPQWRRVLRLWTGGREDEAIRLSERNLRIWPHHPLVWNARFMVLAFSGRVPAAIALSNAPNPVLNSHPVLRDQWAASFAALSEPTVSNLAAARKANLEAAKRSPGQAAYAAMVLSQLGQLDAAFQVIDAVLLARGPLVTGLSGAPGKFLVNSPSWCRTQWLFMPPLAAVRADRRFAAICEEIGLKRYWQGKGGGPDLKIGA